METLKTIKAIKQAVDNGLEVFADNTSYLVIKASTGQYLIKCILNDTYVGLHGIEGTYYENNLNGHSFFIMN